MANTPESRRIGTVKIADSLIDHGKEPTIEGARAFLYELGVLLEDIFENPGDGPAYPNALAETFDLAAVLIRGGHY
jgi:hypothetical protein